MFTKKPSPTEEKGLEALTAIATALIEMNSKLDVVLELKSKVDVIYEAYSNLNMLK